MATKKPNKNAKNLSVKEGESVKLPEVKTTESARKMKKQCQPKWRLRLFFLLSFLLVLGIVWIKVQFGWLQQSETINSSVAAAEMPASYVKQPLVPSYTKEAPKTPQIVDVTNAVTGETSAEGIAAEAAAARAVQATLALSQKSTTVSAKSTPSMAVTETITTNPQTGEKVRTVVHTKEVPVEKPVLISQTPGAVQQALSILNILLNNPALADMETLESLLENAPLTVKEAYGRYVTRLRKQTEEQAALAQTPPPMWEKMLNRVMTIEKRPENLTETTSLQQRKQQLQQAVLVWAQEAAN